MTTLRTILAAFALVVATGAWADDHQFEALATNAVLANKLCNAHIAPATLNALYRLALNEADAFASISGTIIPTQPDPLTTIMRVVALRAGQLDERVEGAGASAVAVWCAITKQALAPLLR